MELELGKIYNITGGKYKKYGKGELTKINPTYSDVWCQWNEAGGLTKIKVKNCYLHINQDEEVVEMPDVNELLVIDGNPDEFIEKSEEQSKNVKEQIEMLLEDQHPDVQEMFVDSDEDDLFAVGGGSAGNVEMTIKEKKITQKEFDDHWKDEWGVAMAERDQADERCNEQEKHIKAQDEKLLKAMKRNRYLEEIVRKLLLP
tara:strand:- start:765 stop:1367 length:603 start_codon:yes stop_codon:yes gene_type:complete